MTETRFLKARFPNGALAVEIRDFEHACRVAQDWQEVFIGAGEPEFSISIAKSLRDA